MNHQNKQNESPIFDTNNKTIIELLIQLTRQNSQKSFNMKHIRLGKRHKSQIKNPIKSFELQIFFFKNRFYKNNKAQNPTYYYTIIK